MKTLLLTGFEPFGNDRVNPSWEAVKAAADKIGDYEIRKLLLPVVFGKAAEKAIAEAAAIKADAVLSVGLAGSRKAMTPEMLGMNLMVARIPDNEGQTPMDVPCVEGAPDGLFSTLPVRKMAEAIAAAGVPAQVSYSAGAYVCNDTLYRLLEHFKGSSVKAGFIHLPYLPEQTPDGSGMPLEDMVKGLTAAIEAM